MMLHGTLRWTAGTGALIGLLAVSSPAHAALDKYTLESFGGTYLADCAKPQGPRVVLEADAIVVIDGAKRVSSPHLEGAASWYGQGANEQPEYRTCILARKGEDPGLVFALYEDAKGYYGKLDNDFTDLKGIRPEVLAMTFRLCRLTAALAPTAAPAPAPATKAAPAANPAPGAKATTAGAATAASIEPDSSGGAAAMMKDKNFRAAYTKAMGPRMRERWIAVLDGPAPPNRTVKLGGQEFVQVAACKAHDCAENNMMVLWFAPKKQMYGIVRQAGVNALLGAPPADLTPEVTRLWKETWRPEEAPAP